MRFHCKNCNQKLNVPQTRAGKKGKCPKCGEVLVVPQPSTEAADEPASPLHELLFAHGPESSEPESKPVAESDASDQAYEQVWKHQGAGLTHEEDEVHERKLPWMIDIFLYPLSQAGLVMLLISVGMPLILRALAKLFMAFTIVFAPALILWVLFIILHWSSLVVFVAYLCWYACEAIRDSAAGRLRAPETAGSSPGLGEILGQTLRCIACLAFYMAPALLYLARVRRADAPFWTLYGIGGFLIPMAILAAVMFESIRMANPILVGASILSTFLPYSALAVFCYGPCLLIPIAGFFMLHMWALGYLFLFVSFYLLLILSHLLGRFYYKYEAKLNWQA